MNDKLREIREKLEEHKWKIHQRMIDRENAGEDLTITRESRGYIDGKIAMFDELEPLINQPKHETVEQWESRTGETYPDDGPVWYKVGNDWRMDTYWYRDFAKFKTAKIIVANHHGKPEEV